MKSQWFRFSKNLNYLGLSKLRPGLWLIEIIIILLQLQISNFLAASPNLFLGNPNYQVVFFFWQILNVPELSTIVSRPARTFYPIQLNAVEVGRQPLKGNGFVECCRDPVVDGGERGWDAFVVTTPPRNKGQAYFISWYHWPTGWRR